MSFNIGTLHGWTMIPPEDLLLNENPSDSLWYTSCYILSYWSRRFQRLPRTPTISIAIGWPPALDGKTLF